MNMSSWHYPRDTFAKFILDGMKEDLLSRVSLFAPRKRGKTQFIKSDVIPLCYERGILPVYIDFWSDETSPELAFGRAVDDAYENHLGFFEKIAEKVNISPKIDLASLTVSATLSTKVSAKEACEISSEYLHQSFKKLEKCNMPILLLLDEVQHLATDNKFKPFTAALRGFMVNRGDQKVKGIFTGSSQQGLTRLFNDTKAPFYNSSQTLTFKELGKDFVAFELNVFKERTGVELDLAKAIILFEKQNKAPARLVELLGMMVLECVHDIDEGAARFDIEIEKIQNKSNTNIIEGLNELDIVIFKLIAMGSGNGLYTPGGEIKIQALSSSKVATSKTSISNSINRLKSKGLIYSPQRGKWILEDPSFRDFLLELVQ